MRDGAPGSYGRRCRSSQHGWWMVWAATKYSLELVAGEKINGKMACALTDDGKTIGSYIQSIFIFRGWLIRICCISVTTSDNRLSSST